MDFWNSLKVLARRWYIVGVGLVVTLGAAMGVNLLIAPSYTAAGSLVLAVPPNLPERASAANPYLAYGNLSVAARIVASGMNQPSVVREQRSKGATGDFVVDLDPERTSPIITVNSTAASAEEAIRTVQVVTEGVQVLLAERQRALGAPQNTWITASSVVVPEEANRAIGSRLRAVSAVLVLGFIGTLTLAFAVEGVAQARSAPTAGPQRLGAGAGPGAPGPLAAPPAAPPPYSPPPPEPAPYPPALAPVGVCPLCRTAFRSAEDLAWHLEEAHELNGGPPAPPARLRPLRRLEAAAPEPAPPEPEPPEPEPAEPEPPQPAAPRSRRAPRRPLTDAAAAANPPARRPVRPPPPTDPPPPTRPARKAANPSARPPRTPPPAP